MNVSNVTDTVINTAVGTAAIVGAPPSIVDVETAKNGNLFINYAHGRYGGWRYTFRYQNSDFELIGYDLHYNRGPVPQYETSINFVTRKKLTRDNINKDDGGEDYEVLFEETWQDISIEELIRLSEVADFDDLDHVDFYSVP